MVIEAIAIMVALSLPLWLVAEQVTVWGRPRRNPRGRGESAGGPWLVDSNARRTLPTPRREAA
jgi:hypothetical protein